jgi:hypothetical protein
LPSSETLLPLALGEVPLCILDCFLCTALLLWLLLLLLLSCCCCYFLS